jgi:hypothetical protein
LKHLKKKCDEAAHILSMLRVLPYVPTESIPEAFKVVADVAEKYEKVG